MANAISKQKVSTHKVMEIKRRNEIRRKIMADRARTKKFLQRMR